jgi:hypothetical protein
LGPRLTTEAVSTTMNRPEMAKKSSRSKKQTTISYSFSNTFLRVKKPVSQVEITIAL